MDGIRGKSGTGRDTRAHLIAHGVGAMLRHGYDGVGIGGILASAEVPKGSFYHFFASKEDFALAVIEAYQAHYAAIRRTLFARTDRAALDRLNDYIDALEVMHGAERPLAGCLYGMLAQTAGDRGDRMRASLTQVLAAWQADLAALLAAARTAGETAPDCDPDETAALLIDCYEGALIRAKADPTQLGACFARLRRLLRITTGAALQA
jgi:TetR/AcrR family transcriptional regulator, transcriptional repressor for nem operon